MPEKDWGLAVTAQPVTDSPAHAGEHARPSAQTSAPTEAPSPRRCPELGERSVCLPRAQSGYLQPPVKTQPRDQPAAFSSRLPAQGGPPAAHSPPRAQCRSPSPGAGSSQMTVFTGLRLSPTHRRPRPPGWVGSSPPPRPQPPHSQPLDLQPLPEPPSFRGQHAAYNLSISQAPTNEEIRTLGFMTTHSPRSSLQQREL